MGFDYWLSGLLAGWIIERRDRKKRKICNDDLLQHECADDSLKNVCDTSSVHTGTDGGWRDKYQDNLANVDPAQYETLGDFLWVCEPVMAVIHREYTKTIQNQLIELTGKNDLRIAAAIIYSGLKTELSPKEFRCAADCLSEIIERNGIKMGTVVSIAEQLTKAIEVLEEKPETAQEFKIIL